MIPKRHQKMLLNILDLEKVTVDDIMVPRNELDGIDLDNPIDVILEQLEQTAYTRVLVYHGSIDHVAGFVHTPAGHAGAAGRGTDARDPSKALSASPTTSPRARRSTAS